MVLLFQVPEFALYNHLSYSSFSCFLFIPRWFPLPFDVWKMLRFVIVALPGLFSYPFFCIPRLLCFCHVESLESLPVHSFNGVIISSARVCTLQSPFVFLFPMILIYTSLVSSSSWCLGRAAVCNCGTHWTFLLPLFCIGQVLYQLELFFGEVCQNQNCPLGCAHSKRRWFKVSPSSSFFLFDR